VRVLKPAKVSKPPSPYEQARGDVLKAAQDCVSMWLELLAMGDDTLGKDTLEGKLILAIVTFQEREKYHKAAKAAWDTKRHLKAKQEARKKARLKNSVKQGKKSEIPLRKK